MIGIVGPSGCGKTTLLELVAGLRRGGRGDDLGRRARPSPRERLERCAYMPQRDLLLPWLSALDNAALALRIAGVPRQEARARAGGALRAARAGRLRGAPGPMSSPAACASASPSCAR